MNRADFQQLAEIRVLEATALQVAGSPEGAFYLAGYAVECGLKACIAKLTKEFDFPPDKAFIEKCYTHDLVKLRAAAGLDQQFQVDSQNRAALTLKWELVKTRKESARYERRSHAEASDMLSAVTDNVDGVLPWIKLYW